jgi:hypothetical protein
VGVGLAVATATLSMTQVGHAQPAAPVDTEPITPTSGQAFLVAQAKGVQIYKCTKITSKTPIPSSGCSSNRGPIW